MQPWGALALTRYSSKDFQFRTTRSGLLLRKYEYDLISDLKLFNKI